MTTRDESRDALAKMLQGLHGKYEEKQKRDDEFTIAEYAEAQTPPLALDQAYAEINKLLQLGTITFSRKCLFQGKERNAYKFVE